MLQNPELHYLDNAATTIVAPEVADVIDKAMREHWANPSSLYGPGARSEEALNAARAAVARTLGCKAKELYFTSCGSESNNLALLFGVVDQAVVDLGLVAAVGDHVLIGKAQLSGDLRDGLHFGFLCDLDIGFHPVPSC